MTDKRPEAMVGGTLLTAGLDGEADVARAGGRGRALAARMGFPDQDQVRIATAVSELARHAVRTVGAGRVTFHHGTLGGREALFVRVLATNEYSLGVEDVVSASSQGAARPVLEPDMGLEGAERVMDHFAMLPGPSGVVVEVAKLRPDDAPRLDPNGLDRLAAPILDEASDDPYAELRRQNRELLQLLAELRRQQDALERSSLLRERVLGIVAHDLRNPLNAIVLNVELLRGCAAGDAGDQASLDGIVDSTTTMNRLIGDLLDAANIEAGQLAIERQVTSMKAIVDRAAELVRAAAVIRGVTVEVEVGVDLPAVDADPQRMVQILSNLLSNAIDHSPHGGTVRIVVTQEHAPNDHTPDDHTSEQHTAGQRATDDDTSSYLHVAVNDDGPGVDPSLRERIFDRFWRGRKRRANGAGLGLAIARGIVEAHDGRIWVGAAPSGGASFQFTVPVGSASA